MRRLDRIKRLESNSSIDVNAALFIDAIARFTGEVLTAEQRAERIAARAEAVREALRKPINQRIEDALQRFREANQQRPIQQ